MLYEIKSREKDKWLSLLKEIGKYDFYHTADYNRLAEISENGEAVLIQFKNGKYIIALPIIIRKINNIQGLESSSFYDATSVYGYAGPLRSHEEIPDQIIKLFNQELEEYLVEKKIVCLFSRLNPLLKQMDLLQNIGIIERMSETISISLDKSNEEQLKGMRKNTRYDIRKLNDMGFRCFLDNKYEYLNEFIAIYLQTMKRVNANKYYFFDEKYFLNLLKSTDYESKLILCSFENKIVSGSIFIKTGNIVQYHLAGTNDSYIKYGSMKMIINSAREMYTNEGAQALHLGGGVGSAEDSLFKFKAGFSNNRHYFNIWKWILFKEDYDYLCEEMNKKYLNSNISYFPLYRSPKNI